MSCRNCGARLRSAPEYEKGAWFIRCLVCGVQNLVSVTLEIVGWRT